ncbi:MAG: response regulator [Geobacteraceae bacterium]|nr:response regulator [Geobacteraceae bacterium]
MRTAQETAYNAFTLSYLDRELEAAFREDYCDRRLPHLRLDLLVGLFFYVLFGIHDYWVIPDIKEYAWLIRYVFVCPLIITVYVFSYSRHMRRMMQFSQSVAAFSASAGVVLMIVKAEPPGNYMSYAGLLLCMLFYFRLRFVSAAVLTIGTLLLYEIIALWDARIPTTVLFSNTFILSSFSIFEMYMCYTVEKSFRSGFLLRRIVEERNMQIWEAYNELEKEILERKQAETALLEQMKFLRALLDTIPNPIFYTDVDGRYAGCNKAYETFSGRRKEDIVGEAVPEVCLAALGELTGEGKPVQWREPGSDTFDIQLRHADGTPRSVIFSRATYGDIEGNVAGALGVILDITPLKLAEDEKLHLESQLFQAQKMEAVGQLAGGIAHEFNNILTAILGYANLLRKFMTDGDPLGFYVSNIVVSGERAARLIKDLLAFSRKQKIEPNLLDLNDVLEKAESLLSMMIGEDIDLRVSVCDCRLNVMADGVLIRQVLVNLAVNARDAMPNGGVLSMATNLLETEREFVHAHGTARPGKYGVITVSDGGIGMDRKTKERIFEPFFTTKEVGKGTGLGLSMVYGIINQHSGHIAVDSEFGSGTTFRIYLPISLEREGVFAEVSPFHATMPWSPGLQASGAGASPAVNEDPYPGGSEMLLVAEDNYTVRLLTKNLLQENGYSVIEAVNGEDALQKFMEQADNIRLLLLDVIMPKRNGWEVFDAIRKIRPEIRVIFMSGYTAEVFQQRAIPEGGMNVLAKPIPPGTLLRTVRKELDR